MHHNRFPNGLSDKDGQCSLRERKQPGTHCSIACLREGSQAACGAGESGERLPFQEGDKARKGGPALTSAMWSKLKKQKQCREFQCDHASSRLQVWHSKSSAWGRKTTSESEERTHVKKGQPQEMTKKVEKSLYSLPQPERKPWDFLGIAWNI